MEDEEADPLAALFQKLEDLEQSDDEVDSIPAANTVGSPENRSEKTEKITTAADVERSPSSESRASDTVPPPISLHKRLSFVKLQQEKRKRQSDTFGKDYSWKDTINEIKVIDRKISIEKMETRLSNFEMLSFTQISLKAKSRTLPPVWGFYAVVGPKKAKQSSKGKKYLVIRLTDFSHSINLIIFESSLRARYSELPEGTIICLGNPTILDSKSKYQGVALLIDSANQIIEVGRAKDFGMCQGKTDGKACGNVVNTSEGRYCAYHVKTEYKRMAGRRSDVNRSLVRRPSFGSCIKDISAGDFSFNGDDLNKKEVHTIKQNRKISKEMKKGVSRRSLTLVEAAITPKQKSKPLELPKLGQGFGLKQSFDITPKGKSKELQKPKKKFQIPQPRSKALKPPLGTAKRKGSTLGGMPRRKRRKALAIHPGRDNKSRKEQRKHTPMYTLETFDLPLSLRNPGNMAKTNEHLHFPDLLKFS